MNVKKYLVTSLIAVTAVATLFNPGTAKAAESESITTDGKIRFVKQDDSAISPPVNPLNPDQTIDPADGETPYPGTGGPLSIDYASTFDFGNQEITGETKVYNAKLDKIKVDGSEIEVPNNVQITDNRGTNSGWQLNVSQNGQLKDAADRELNGAKITIKKGTPTTKSDADITAPTANTEINLNPNGDASSVMVADTEQGMGKWVDKFGVDNTEAADAVTLTVPGKSAKYADSEYATTLTWTLSDTPE
ncbi:WxL domain-containing protein [Listeria booriae]|uniref:WxL domain-containing protein n=1 Tax=Listeria booriae TaxID=1552123 RepID=A0A099W0M0_9LIST|nr:WxL domain-containing protein [Listeria booriae]KGL37933.1 hypothetical protein EP57_15355 [Listeria booriae]STY45930.1 Uncharacterised protein [Listeria booriae]